MTSCEVAIRPLIRDYDIFPVLRWPSSSTTSESSFPSPRSTRNLLFVSLRTQAFWGGGSHFFFWFSCEDTLDIVTDFHQRWWTLFLSGGSGTVLQPTRTYDYWSICITATRQLPRHDPSLERTRPSRSLRLGLWKINFVFVFLPVSRWVDWRYLSTMPWLLCICLGME